MTLVVALAIASFALLAAMDGAAAQGTIMEPLDRGMVERHGGFGYSPTEIDRWFDVPLVVPLDRSGLDRGLLGPPPAPGIHPRVLFGPDELPGIRRRLESTAAGMAVMGSIRRHIAAQLGPHGRHRAVFEKLVAGDAGTPFADIRDVAYVVLYECFRCLVDDDREAGVRAAAAVTTLARMAASEIAVAVAAQKNLAARTDFRLVAQGPTYEGTLGLMYDFTHGFMTPAQRDLVRAACVTGSAGMTYIGCETLRTLDTDTSNWIPWSSRMLFLCAAIEGEPGHDPTAYDRCVRAMTGYVASLFETGEAFEGWGKNFLFLEHLAVIARRGTDLIAAAHLRNAFRIYFVAAMNPWGGGFTFYDSLGGSGARISRTSDLVMYRFFYPGDAAGELVYRTQIGDNPSNVIPRGDVNTRHPFGVTEALCCAIYISDFDASRSWEDLRAAVVKDRPLSLFSADTCNLITRSAWTPDCLWVDYLNRAVPGGHKYCDRSHFSLSSHGRMWGTYAWLRQVREQYRPENRSVVLVDGDGPSTAPGKCVLYEDGPLATAIATDLRVAWDYVNNYVIPNPKRERIVPLPFSYDDFRLHPSGKPWMKMPIADLPDWLTSVRSQPLGERPAPTAGWTKRTLPIDHAFRTTVLVRGPRPYLLVVDDVRRDGRVHDYVWGMTVANDVRLGGVMPTTAAARPAADILLDEAEPGPRGARRLLVRVLEADGLDREHPAELATVRQSNPPHADTLIPKLVVRCRGVEPRFKILLYPHHAGDPLPKIAWNPGHAAVTIAWADQADRVTFASDADGRTHVAIDRDGEAILGTMRGAP